MTSTAPSSSGNSSIDKPILDYVPDSLNRLAIFVSKIFLSRDHYIVMDFIIKKNCIREEDIRSILKLDQKHMRMLLLQLKQDKLIKERQATEEYEGKPRKINYYFTNYRAIVNVAKYKIDHMRQRLEAREKTKVHKATYKCTGCSNSYDALDMDRICDFTTGKMTCWRCMQEVEMDKTVGPDTETRSSLAKFNEQMTAFFSMIQELDGIQLAPHLLEPRLPAATIIVKADESKAPTKLQVGERAFRNTEANRSEMFKSEFGIRVTIDDGAPIEKETTKEAVPWLAAAAHEDTESSSIDRDLDAADAIGQSSPKKIKLAENDILGLLREELDNPSASQSPSASNHVSVSYHAPNDSGEPSQSGPTGPTDFSSMLVEEESFSQSSAPPPVADEYGQMSDGDDGDEFVHVQGVKYAFDDITTDLVEKMTEAEKKHYTEMTMNQYDY